MPRSLAEWKLCAKDLEERQARNQSARQSVTERREAISLSAMRGDVAAGRELTELTAAEADLSREAEALAAGVRSSAQAIAAAERAEVEATREAMVERQGARLRERLKLVEKIEQRLLGLSPLLESLDASSQEVEHHYRQLGGSPHLLASLSRESISGRIAEFVGGIGLGAWLPLAKPEIRPAIPSLVAAEEMAQRSYRPDA